MWGIDRTATDEMGEARQMNRREIIRYSCALLGASGLGVSGAFAAQKILNIYSEQKRDEKIVHCGGPDNASFQFLHTSLKRGELSITGTRLLKDGFLDDLATPYMEDSGRLLKVLGGDCSKGIGAVRFNQTHLGSLCCPVKGSPGEGLGWLPVAEDLKIVLTHPSNPVSSLDIGELRAIVSGKIKRWSEVGGEDIPIALVVDRHCPDFMEPVRQVLLNGDSYPTKNVLTANNDQDMLRTVGRFRSSIAINSWVIAAPFVEQGILKDLAVNGIRAHSNGAIADDYPLTGPFNLIFKYWDPVAMGPFFDFLFSPRGRELIQRKLRPINKEEAFNIGYLPRINSRQSLL